MRLLAPALAAIILAAAGSAYAAAPPSDGFAAFWTQFTVALAKNDKAAALKLMKPSTLGDGPGASRTIDQYYARNFGPRVRTCLVKQKPVRDAHDGTVSYSAFCGELIYVFEKVGGTWKFTDLGAND